MSSLQLLWFPWPCIHLISEQSNFSREESINLMISAHKKLKTSCIPLPSKICFFTHDFPYFFHDSCTDVLLERPGLAAPAGSESALKPQQTVMNESTVHPVTLFFLSPFLCGYLNLPFPLLCWSLLTNYWKLPLICSVWLDYDICFIT